ncbi:MAG: hypothetical protein J4431_02920 [Candidatus Aenigmarchaeota archaeon]|nr:hypothetical protein [Candidatus Aenigmarchaeota archaeon]
MGFLPWRKKYPGNAPKNHANPWNVDLTPYIERQITVYQHGIVKTNDGRKEVRHTRQSGYLSQIYPDGSLWLGATPKAGSGGRNIKAHFNGSGVDMTTYKITAMDDQGLERTLYDSRPNFSYSNITDKDSSAPPNKISIG